MSGFSDRIDDFDFELPDDLIALRPVSPREDARLLVVRGPDGALEDRQIRDLPALLSRNDVLVLNTSRVIKAALSAVRPARSEIGSDVTLDINLNRRLASDVWSAFVRPARRVAVDDIILFSHGVTAAVTTTPEDGECNLRFNHEGVALDRLIEAIGSAPLPPYITSKRSADDQDVRDYQTSFAETGESVAAPTAGLHLSDTMLGALRQAGIGTLRVRLDVNAGTFRPVKSEHLSQHRMHCERAIITQEVAEAIEDARSVGGRCVAVGTTSMRVLESAAKGGALAAMDADTDIFIRPGFEFRVCDALLTNFHLPRSTLFVLVSALMGRDVMRRAYEHAIKERYRFFSYGDACLLLPHG